MGEQHDNRWVNGHILYIVVCTSKGRVGATEVATSDIFAELTELSHAQTFTRTHRFS